MSDHQDQVTPRPPRAGVDVVAQLDIRLQWVAEEDGRYATVYINGDIASGPWDTDYESKLRATRKAIKKLVRGFIDDGDEAMPCRCGDTEQARLAIEE